MGLMDILGVMIFIVFIVGMGCMGLVFGILIQNILHKFLKIIRGFKKDGIQTKRESRS